MESELSIKLEYLENRKNPAEVFEAMALYINVYREFGQLLTNSVGIKYDFEFQLSDIEKGSILSKLSVISDLLDRTFKESVYSSGNKLFERIVDTNETGEEEEVESIAVDLEAELSKNMHGHLAEPYIDRQNLACVLSHLSSANQKTMDGENVFVISGVNDSEVSAINTKWRFTGNPKTMFLGKTESHDNIKDNLSVNVTVNEGNSVWSFKSLSTDKRFSARILHKDWLEQYQNGLVQPIGPKDVVEAELSYEIYTPRKGKGKPQIRNARIKKIIDIRRNGQYQYEL